jgi:hypothetical protein
VFLTSHKMAKEGEMLTQNTQQDGQACQELSKNMVRKQFSCVYCRTETLAYSKY